MRWNSLSGTASKAETRPRSLESTKWFKCQGNCARAYICNTKVIMRLNAKAGQGSRKPYNKSLMIIALINIFPFIILTSYLTVAANPRFRIIEKLIAIFLLAYLSINLNVNYFQDFAQYVEWIIKSHTVVHRDYLFTAVMKVLNLFPDAATSLRCFIFLFYTLIMINFSKHNTMLFMTNPIILDCLFNSQRAGIALSLITILFFQKPITNVVGYCIIFYVHRYLSVFMFLTQAAKLFTHKYKITILIFCISMILFFNSGIYHNLLINIKNIIYLLVDHGKSWSEFYSGESGSLRGNLSRFVNVSTPAILVTLCSKHVDKKILSAILITTSLILILGHSFPAVYRLSLVSYLLLTRVEISSSKAQILKILVIVLGTCSLVINVEYSS